jgi:hypothetical protein
MRLIFFLLLLYGSLLRPIIGNPFGVYSGQLVFADIVTSRSNISNVDNNGFLTILQGPPVSLIETFSMDVGFNRGQTTVP